jgi:hypothetical protein
MLPAKMTANHSNLVNVLMVFLFISVLEDESVTLCTIPVHGALVGSCILKQVLQYVEQVDSIKYLGVLLTSDLTGNEHISRICNKTRKLIGLIYRRFHHCHPDLMLKLYKAFIHPHLEYTMQVWDPHLIKDIELLN